MPDNVIALRTSLFLLSSICGKIVKSIFFAIHKNSVSHNFTSLSNVIGKMIPRSQKAICRIYYCEFIWDT